MSLTRQREPASLLRRPPGSGTNAAATPLRRERARARTTFRPEREEGTVTTDDDTEARVRVLEEELTVVKNQVQQTLLDIREHIFDLTNPFQATPENEGAGGDDGKDADE